MPARVTQCIIVPLGAASSLYPYSQRNRYLSWIKWTRDWKRRILIHTMKDRKSLGLRGAAMFGTAIGAVAAGAFAIGALAVGRFAIRRLLIESAEFKKLHVEDLVVTRIRASEVIVSDSLELPKGS